MEQETRQIEPLYINNKNRKRCNEWYSLLNINREFTPKEELRFNKLDKEFGCKFFIFANFPAPAQMLKESQRNEIIMAFGMIVNYHKVAEKEQRFFKRRFKYLFDIQK